jgi:ATP-dependent protease ClpP protease subunit
MSNEPTKAQLEYTKLLAEIQKLSLESQQMEHNIYFQQTQRDLSRREHAYSYMLGSVDVMSLKYLNADIREWRDDNRTDRLVVSISSPGGDVFSGLGMFDAIADGVAAGLDLETEVRGCACSMASAIAQAGKHRTITTNSWLMIHQVGAVRQQLMQLTEMQDQVDLLKTLQDRLNSLYLFRSNLTADELERRTTRQDWWIGSAEALDLGLVDEVTK